MTSEPLGKSITSWGVGNCQPAAIGTVDILWVPECCVAEGAKTSKIDIGKPEDK